MLTAKDIFAQIQLQQLLRRLSSMYWHRRWRVHYSVQIIPATSTRQSNQCIL